MDVHQFPINRAGHSTVDLRFFFLPFGGHVTRRPLRGELVAARRTPWCVMVGRRSFVRRFASPLLAASALVRASTHSLYSNVCFIFYVDKPRTAHKTKRALREMFALQFTCKHSQGFVSSQYSP